MESLPLAPEERGRLRVAEPEECQTSGSAPKSIGSGDGQAQSVSPSRASNGRQQQSTGRQQAQAAAVEPRKCWICYLDETEDGAAAADWRRPCPCALTAHEACLLDWIGRMEAPDARQLRSTVAVAPVRCPQCKATIDIARPRSLVAEALTRLERLQQAVVFPAFLAVGGLVLHHALLVHGMATIYVVFGLRDGGRVLAPLARIRDLLFSGTCTAPDLARLLVRHWHLFAWVPLIGPALVLSRTRVADPLLTVLPMLFFTLAARVQDPLALLQWPPSPALTFSLLPYARSVYFTCYDRMWRDKEARWTNAVLPPASTDADDAAQPPHNQPANQQDAGRGLLGMGFDLTLHLDAGAGGAGAGAAAAGDIAPPDEQREAGPGAAAAAAAAAVDEPPDPVQVLEHHHATQINGNQIVGTFVGAIAFPAIAASAGQLLRAVLPPSWTVPVSAHGRRPTGLLQTWWGRSVVGGCLFVVLKDALLLYVKWRMAQMHSNRKVMNYDKSRAGLGRGWPFWRQGLFGRV